MAARFERQVAPTQSLPVAPADGLAEALEGFSEVNRRRARAQSLNAAELAGRKAGIEGNTELSSMGSEAGLVYNQAARQGLTARALSQSRMRSEAVLSSVTGTAPGDVEKVEAGLRGVSEGILAGLPADMQAEVGLDLDTRAAIYTEQVRAKFNAHEFQNNVSAVKAALEADALDLGTAFRDGREDLGSQLFGRVQGRVGELVGLGQMSEAEAEIQLSQVRDMAATEGLVGSFQRRHNSAAGALAAVVEFQRNPPESLDLNQRKAALAGMSSHATALAKVERQAKAAVTAQTRAVKVAATDVLGQLNAGNELNPQQERVRTGILNGTIPAPPDVALKIEAATMAAVGTEKVKGLSLPQARAVGDNPDEYLAEMGPDTSPAHRTAFEKTRDAAKKHAKDLESDLLGYGSEVSGDPLAPFDLGGDIAAQFADRSARLDSLTTDYGARGALLSKTDVAVLRQHWPTLDDGERLQFLSGMVGATDDPDLLGRTIESLDKDDEVSRSMLAAIDPLERGDGELAAQILLGQKKLPQLKGTGEDALNERRVYAQAEELGLGGVLPLYTREGRSMLAGALYLAAAEATSVDDSQKDGQINTALLRLAGAPSVINGRQILLPQGFDAERLQDAVQVVTAEDLAALPGVSPQVDLAELAEGLREGWAEFGSLSPNDVRIFLHGETVPGADGAAWVISTQKLGELAEKVPPTQSFFGGLLDSATQALGRLNGSAAVDEQE